MTAMANSLRVGTRVRVPWGLDNDVEGTVVEVWGDPPTQVRVQLDIASDDDAPEPIVILLSPAMLSAA